MSNEELMSDIVFDKLNDCDPGLAWKLLRERIGNQLLGETQLTIPFIDDAATCVPFGVIISQDVKIKSSHTKSSSEPVYRVVGSMTTLSASEMDVSPFQQRPALVERKGFNSEYVYKCTNVRHGLKKSITVKISGTKCYDVSMSGEVGHLALNRKIPELKDVNEIYIIFEVYYANSFKISVTIGEQMGKSNYIDTKNGKFVQDMPMPIGFSVQKFPLLPNGLIGLQEETDFKKIRNAEWKRSSRKRFAGIRSAASKQRNENLLRSSHTLPPFPIK